MNIFASDRIGPANVKFPKGFDKLTWTHIKNYTQLCDALKANSVGAIVLDSSASGNMNARICSYALTEITCDKHTNLPSLLVVGTDQGVKVQVDNIIAQAKRWIDLNRGK